MFISKNIKIIGLGCFLLGFFVSSPSIQAQQDARRNVEYVENEDHDSEELENLIEDYRKKNSKVIDSLNEMNRDGNITESEKLKLLNMYSGDKGAGKFDIAEMLNKMAPAIQMINQHFGAMPYEVARSEIELSLSKTPAKVIFTAMPKGIDFVTSLIRDDKALLAALVMFKDKTKLYKFLAINLFVFFLGFFILRSSKDANLLKRLSKWTFKKALLTTIRLGTLVYFFGNELGPTWNIFLKTFA